MFACIFPINKHCAKDGETASGIDRGNDETDEITAVQGI